MKVYISPTADQVRDDNGVGKVILAQHKYLPDFGIEIVNDPNEADIINAHITDKGLPRSADCLSIHGLYWTGDKNSGHYAAWHYAANQQIIAAARRAIELTVPSAWVGECFKRDMRRVPHVIGHGIDLAEWKPADHKGYILWNKNRNTDVCDPTPALELARRGYEVVSTFAPIGVRNLPSTFHVIGTVDHATMKELIRHADLYLATTKETFGIGTLEALACGVPVVGYEWGGTADIFRDSEANCLVEPGDTAGLARMVELVLRDRYIYGSAAWLLAREYSWSNVMRQYVEVYELALAKKRKQFPAVSIVITNYNYGAYVDQTIKSAVTQTLCDEVIVVDDGSTDHSDIVLGNYENDPVVTIIYQDNQGVAAARNNGIAASHGEFIVCLDADDTLSPSYVETLLPALQDNPDLGIAYSGLALLGDDGVLTRNDWPGPFSWEAQATPHNPPSNCIPCAAMFRRDMWQRSGGYKQVYAPAEDTEFWTRGLSIGYLAKQVTTEALFHYRNHPASASKTKQYKPIDTWHPWMHDKQYPMAAPASKMPLVRSYSEPLISVIIPVGPGHAQYLPAALDSLLGQTFREWECIVVDDSANEVDCWFDFTPYPFVKWATTPGKMGAGHARNRGLDMAEAPLVLFLDADDWLDPTALEKMLGAYLASGGKYVYSDWFGVDDDGVQIQQTPNYTRTGWLQNGMHAVTALIETEHVRHVGGFDETLVGWEDWDFFIKLTINGVCGVRIAEPLLYYRRYSGTWRRLALANKDAKRNELLRDRYGDYVTGVKTMAPCCGGNGDTLIKVKQAFDGGSDPAPIDALVIDGQVRLEFIGLQTGAITFYGKSGRTYRGGNNPYEKFINADEGDVAHLVGSGKWQVVRPVQQEVNTTPDEVLGISDVVVGDVELANKIFAGPNIPSGIAFTRGRPLVPEDLIEFKDDPVVDHITRDNAHSFTIDPSTDDPATTFVQTDGDGFPVVSEPRKRGRPVKQ